jgi:hypothetical protein
MGKEGGIGERVISAEAAGLLTWMMHQAVESGTGTRARLPGRQAAGKTGTTQAARDAWFVGFTADYVTGVWMGYDDNTPLTGVTGGGLPAEIWQEVMVRIHEGVPPRPLPMIDPGPPLAHAANIPQSPGQAAARRAGHDRRPALCAGRQPLTTCRTSGTPTTTQNPANDPMFEPYNPAGHRADPRRSGGTGADRRAELDPARELTAQAADCRNCRSRSASAAADLPRATAGPGRAAAAAACIGACTMPSAGRTVGPVNLHHIGQQRAQRVDHRAGSRTADRGTGSAVPGWPPAAAPRPATAPDRGQRHCAISARIRSAQQARNSVTMRA